MKFSLIILALIVVIFFIGENFHPIGGFFGSIKDSIDAFFASPILGFIGYGLLSIIAIGIVGSIFMIIIMLMRKN